MEKLKLLDTLAFTELIMINLILFPLNIKFENLYLCKHPIRP